MWNDLEHFLINNFAHIMDVFSITFFASITIDKLCKLNIHNAFGDGLYYVGGFLTLAWLTFRALSSFEDWRMKRKAREFQNEVFNEASKK